MIKRLISLSLLMLSVMITNGQTRPIIDDGPPQKANKRLPQPSPSQPKIESPTSTPTPEANQSEKSGTASETTAADNEVLRVDTNLVTVPVKVSDRKNRFVPGLKKEDFKVFEDGQEQEIAYFSNEEEPFTVALVLDMSYSAKFKINEIQTAAIAFINQLHPNDKVLLVSFDQEVHVLSEPTSDRQRLQTAIRSTKIASGTSLYEAIDLVVNEHLKKMSGRKAIVLFTDGVDTSSRRAGSYSNLSDVYELDALIYPIEYDTYSDVQNMKNKPIIASQPSSIPIPGMPSSNPSPLPFPIPTSPVGTPGSQGTSAEDYRKADEYLNELANRTSGKLYQANTTIDLATAFKNIADELRQIYSLGFYPADEKNNKRRQLKVKVNQTGLAVRARDSYSIGKKAK